MIVHMGKKVHTLKGCMVLAVVGGGLALAAYVFTDNLSTAIIIFCITAGLIFVAHPDIKIFIIIAGVVIALAVIGVIFLNATVSVDGSGSFRLRRIMVWLHPEEYADSWGVSDNSGIVCDWLGRIFWQRTWKQYSEAGKCT